jgi:hypothetical protein
MKPQNSDQTGSEFSLSQLLAEPIVQLAMKADAIKPDELVALLNSANLRGHGPPRKDGASAGFQRHGLPALNSLRPARLIRAMEAVKQAQAALRQAERRFDRDCTCESMMLIQQIRLAEATLQAASARLRKLDSDTLDEGMTVPGAQPTARS